ncbi:MAG TPA: alpha-1,2-fucosyltransferase [Bacteroidales bacterium]|nr:alpha-1,2-fucosyltransferase [Bacteroidales bacterium]
MIYSVLKGRVGNNLFQIAAGHSLASRLCTDYKAYIPDFILPEPDKCTLRNYLSQFSDNILRNIEFTDTVPDNILKYSETGDLSFREIPFTDNIILDGYFQSEKYFDEKLVRHLFSIDGKTEDYISREYGDLLRQGVTSINVRRGDYVKQPHLHPVCSMIYYNEAIDSIGRDKLFIVISDDIGWCRRHFRGANFHFIDDEPPVIDLYLQTKCKNNIISNSSFSWWGAWLNPDPEKIVAAPGENWIGKLHPFIMSADLLPETWQKFTNPTDLPSKIIIVKKQAVRKLVEFKKNISAKRKHCEG